MLGPKISPEALREACTGRGVDADTLEAVLSLAVEIAREGREGRKVGTLFTVGDTEAVLARSRPLILDPLAGHPPEARRVTDPAFRETVKELAQLDGAFVVSNDGVAISAARYLDASSEGIALPFGLGSRHMAAASVTRRTRAVAVVASESAVVRMFADGVIVAEILPEIWMLRRYGAELGLTGLQPVGPQADGAASLVFSRAAGPEPNLQVPVTEQDHRRGPDDAPVTVVMYGDFECPYCAKPPRIFRRLDAEHAGRLRLVHRHFPLSDRHPEARRAAEAAEAAGAQGRFWEMHDLLYAHQDELGPERIEALAAQLGLDLERFREDLRTHAFLDRVEADYQGGLKSGVEGTPALFVGGVRYTGRLREEALREALTGAPAEAR